MFNWIKSELKELKKLGNQKKTRMKEEQVRGAQNYFYSPTDDQDLVEAGEKFPLLSAEEILVIRMKASKMFNDNLHRSLEAKRARAKSPGQQVTNNINKYGSLGVGPGIVGQMANGYQTYPNNWPLTPGRAYRDTDFPRFSIEIKKRDGHILFLDDKKELVKQLRRIESKLINEIREEEEKSEKVVKKVKKRKLI
jgi:hypothetical protein